MAVERWSDKRTFLRDWKVVNEQLVVRGEFLLDLEFAKNWDKELEEMNNGKRGHPYEFPNSLIEFQAVLNQWVNIRGIEGITRKVEEYSIIPNYNDYSSAFRRIQKLNVQIPPTKARKVSASTDGSGIKMSSRGEYREDKYGNKGPKKFLRVIITADPFTKNLLDCEVQVDGEGESEPHTAITHLKKLLCEGVTIDKFWGDGAFDSKEMFNFLQKHGILAAIKIRENASSKADGSFRRAREVKEYMEKGYKKWAMDKHYGRRWTGTEAIFSAVKGIFGEKTRSKYIPNMILEVKRRFWAYQRMKMYAEIKMHE